MVGLLPKAAADKVERLLRSSDGSAGVLAEPVPAGTVHFVFLFFVMLYALYFFLTNGRAVLEKILWYLPLEDRDEQRMLGRFL